jgi:hypothetical protein
MSGALVTIESDEIDRLIADVSKLQDETASDKMKSEMGFSVMQLVRAHFAEIAQDSQHHESARSLGAQPSGFYESARNNTQEPEIVSEGVSISVMQIGVAQRYYGGTINARPGSYLTIPALAIAYARRAREFDLRFVIFKSTGLAALLLKGAPSDEGSVYYWLVKSVTQKADPTIIPTDEEITDAASQGASNYLNAVWKSLP